jgi:hypothetical protein
MTTKNYYKNNKEKLKKSMRDYYDSHIDEIFKYQREYYKINMPYKELKDKYFTPIVIKGLGK